MRSRARGWAAGLVGAGRSTLRLAAWPRLSRQRQALYSEAALGEPCKFVRGPHLTAACGPFTGVA